MGAYMYNFHRVPIFIGYLFFRFYGILTFLYKYLECPLPVLPGMIILCVLLQKQGSESKLPLGELLVVSTAAPHSLHNTLAVIPNLVVLWLLNDYARGEFQLCF